MKVPEFDNEKQEVLFFMEKLLTLYGVRSRGIVNKRYLKIEDNTCHKFCGTCLAAFSRHVAEYATWRERQL